ncbi:MAG: DUF92 domain-containing protein [archaeon]
MELFEWGIVGVSLVLLLIFIHTKQLLKPTAIFTGLGAALFVAYRGGLGSFFAIVLFFLAGEFVTRQIRNKYHRKQHGTRSTVNIVGNIGPALIALVLNPISFNVMFFTSLSAAFADTLSSEIGVLSKKQPLLITTLKPATTGEDGAVSLLGFLGAGFGALLYGLLAFVLTTSLYWAGVVFIAGLVGSVLDSFLGATLQKDGYLDNNTNNFVSSFLVGAFFALLF